MLSKSISLPVAAAILAVMSTPAAADVTAQQVWDKMKGLYEGYGLTITANEEQSGDTLSISEMEMSLKVPDEDVSFTQKLNDAITLRELGDGTVAIDLPDEMTVLMEIETSTGDTITPEFKVTHEALNIIVSGQDDDLRYDIEGEQLTYAMTGLQDEEDIAVDATVSLDGIAGFFAVAGTADQTFQSEMLANLVDMSIKSDDPDDMISVSLQFTGVVSKSEGVLPEGSDGPITTLPENLVGETVLSHAGSTYDVNVADPVDGAFQMNGTSQSGSIAVNFSEENLSYQIEGEKLEAVVSGDTIPIPDLGYAMERFNFALNGPVGVSETPEDFGMTLALDALSFTDTLWSMVDPGNVLPRDPASLTVDVSGKANMLVDIFDPNIDPETMTDVPGQIHALDLNELLLNMAGAKLTGSGGFTFDNTDLESFDGMPRPQGDVTLRLDGIDALIEKLVTLGFVAEEQVAGARMMMAIFANPVEGEDALTSTLSIDETGGVFANGQQLR